MLAADAKAPKPEPAIEKNVVVARTELNLQGVTDTASGESRRNENIQFNPIDNNALKEINVRMGTTATIVQEFDVARNYFGAEFGRPAPAVTPYLALQGRPACTAMFMNRTTTASSARDRSSRWEACSLRAHQRLRRAIWLAAVARWLPQC